ncbi:hypothetical protein HHI36_020545 [Cryptolaemus montrouzieri]|uniref:Uncharacterized protein n=1 Tax=Cryptolaemus montrouzieri TaxID=559131 RepID=A0ABD2NC76_9CUCU
MKEAEVVEFRDSIITSLGGPMVPTLPKLKKIVLIDCTIEVDVADVENMFKGAINLREIHLRHIEVGKHKIHALRQTPIEVFIMTDNILPKLPDNCFNETKLKKLELRRDQLEEIDENAFNGLDNLEILDLESNKLKNIPKAGLVPLKNIKHINLKENLIESFGADQIPGLPHLESVGLRYNPLTQLNLDGIEALAPKLREIDIKGSRISNEKIEILKSKHTNITLKT